MLETKELINYANELLDINNYQDYCPNGLQIAGREQISKIITGVSANKELLDKAVANKADAIIVHHGFFWKSENPCIIGVKKQRLQTLLKNNVNLIAYHLPLDYHDTYGNNVQLAKVLDIKIDTLTMLYAYGELSPSMSGQDFASHIKKCLNHEPLYIPGKTKKITTIAWCAGGAENYIEQAAEAGFDAYLTGEVSERAIDIAKEMGIHLFAAGHEVTERYGIRALGEHLAAKFNLEHQFL